MNNKTKHALISLYAVVGQIPTTLCGIPIQNRLNKLYVSKWPHLAPAVRVLGPVGTAVGLGIATYGTWDAWQQVKAGRLMHPVEAVKVLVAAARGEEEKSDEDLIDEALRARQPFADAADAS